MKLDIVVPVLLCLLVIALHELGHLIAAWVEGVEVKGVGLNWTGVHIIREEGDLTQNLLVSLGGPLQNLIQAALFWHSWRGFAMLNLVFGVVNLLPFPSSDGRRAWKCWQQLRVDAALKRREAENQIMERILGNESH